MKQPPLLAKLALTLAGWGLLTPIFSGYFNGFILLCWLVWIFGRKEVAHQSSATRTMAYIAAPIHWGVASVIVFQLVSSLLGFFCSPYASSIEKTLSVSAHTAIKWGLLWFVFYRSMYAVVERRWDPTKIGPWVLFAMTVHFIYCMVQRRTGIDWTHGLAGHLGPHRFAYGVYRISGWHSHPLSLAYNLMLIAAASACLSLKLGSNVSRMINTIWSAVSLIAILTLLFSGSRFVILVFPLAFLMLEFKRLRAHLWRVGTCFFLVGLLLMGEGSLKGRFLELFDPAIPITSRFSRLPYWEVHWRLFWDHPWVGVTIPGVANALKAYWPPEYAQIEILPAHNIYLQTLADSGLVGFMGLVGFILSLALAAQRARLFLGAQSGLEWMLVLTLIVGMMQNNLRDSEYLMAFWYLTSLLIARMGYSTLGAADTSDRIEGSPLNPILVSPHDRQSDQNRNP